MNTGAGPTATSDNRPIFVLGERAAATQLVRALGETPNLCAMPATRLLPDLMTAVNRCFAFFERQPASDHATEHAAGWYREIQAAYLRANGKSRTVEFSGLSILSLCPLFPEGQFVIVRHLARAMPRSQTLPAAALDRILQVDSESVDQPETLALVLAFLAEPLELEAEHVVDISDAAASADRLTR